ncbi:esterase B1-like [Culicoides brevitarsis]|uniref:esterase B1-like n=1 Tax=Culicoides brevitarsis TaxID=469753 RepID=UPI00307B76B2
MSAATSIVSTNSGPVMGISKKTDLGKEFFSFQHIPYAQPPLGELRFRDPKPVKSWSEVVDCTKEGSAATNIDIFLPDGPKLVGSEDCLGLNVFTPDLKPSKPLPVFVWIHGGGFLWGSSSTYFYGPDLVVEKDVIFVSINYRLNIFGFLSLKDPKVGIPGNAGLKDQSMALKWIKENISHFGGDPNNITIAGESAGGASVNYHLISPLSRGLFTRAIAMSGSPLTPWATANRDYNKYLKKFVKNLGLTGDEDDMTIFNAINSKSAEELSRINASLIDPQDMLVNTELMAVFVPQVEPYVSEMCFLPKSPLELGRDPWSKDVDVIFGGVSDEGLFCYYFDNNNMLDFMAQDHRFVMLPEMREGLTVEEARKNGDKLYELYFANEADRVAGFANLETDRQFWHAIHRSIMQRRLHPTGSGKTYLYNLVLDPSSDAPEYYNFLRKLCKIPHRKGTCHTEDFPLIFKTFAPRLMPGHDNYEAQQTFLNYFMSFCHNGSLNAWPALVKGTTEDVQCLEFTRNGSEMKELPNIHKLRIWDSLYKAKDLI